MLAFNSHLSELNASFLRVLPISSNKDFPFFLLFFEKAPIFVTKFVHAIRIRKLQDISGSVLAFSF